MFPHKILNNSHNFVLIKMLPESFIYPAVLMTPTMKITLFAMSKTIPGTRLIGILQFIYFLIKMMSSHVAGWTTYACFQCI